MFFFQKVKIKLLNIFGYFLVNLRYFLRNSSSKNNSRHLTDIRNNGFTETTVNGITNEVNLLLKDELYENNSTSTILEKNNFGIKTISLNLNSDILWKYVFNEELFEIINHHFKGNFYLRNLPVIGFSYEGEKQNQQLFHCDWGLRQLSVMINLSPLDKKNIHMEYVCQSNKKYFFSHPVRFEHGFQKYVDESIQKYKVATTIGKEDSAFIFDAGNGIHRQVPGKGKRILLHLNFVDSLVHSAWSKKWSPKKESLNYWFNNIETGKDILEKIEDSSFHIKNFSLVLRNLKPTFFTPECYSLNYKKSS